MPNTLTLVRATLQNAYAAFWGSHRVGNRAGINRTHLELQRRKTEFRNAYRDAGKTDAQAQAAKERIERKFWGNERNFHP